MQSATRARRIEVAIGFPFGALAMSQTAPCQCRIRDAFWSGSSSLRGASVSTRRASSEFDGANIPSARYRRACAPIRPRCRLDAVANRPQRAHGSYCSLARTCAFDAGRESCKLYKNCRCSRSCSLRELLRRSRPIIRCRWAKARRQFPSATDRSKCNRLSSAPT